MKKKIGESDKSNCILDIKLGADKLSYTNNLMDVKFNESVFTNANNIKYMGLNTCEFV